MGIDLRLTAVPHYEVIENAARHAYYDRVLSEIREPDGIDIAVELEWARETNRKDHEQELMASIKEAQELRQLYPGQDTKPYRFYSHGRGYSTLAFLLIKHCQATGAPVSNFFEGKWQNCDTYNFPVSYLDIENVLQTSHLLSATSFQQLWEQYDYEEVVKNAYKPKGPEAIDYLKEEYQDLVSFFEHAAAFKAYVIIEFY